MADNSHNSQRGRGGFRGRGRGGKTPYIRHGVSCVFCYRTSANDKNGIWFKNAKSIVKQGEHDVALYMCSSCNSHMTEEESKNVVELLLKLVPYKESIVQKKIIEKQHANETLEEE